MIKYHGIERRTRTRRSKRKKPTDITMYYCNVNGFQTKKQSIQKIVDDLKPKILALCETKLPSGNTIKNTLPNYEICSRPTKAGKSGLAIGVKLQTFNSILDVTSTPHSDILSVRIGMAQTAVRIILGYAPQETEKVEVRESFYTELGVEITNCLISNELPIVLGDMNAKITFDNGQIQNNSPNGKLLLEIANNHDLQILNFHEKCIGKWTHVTRTTGASSVLDYVLTVQEITRSMDEIIIDEDCVFCPFRINKVKGIAEPQYSDHNPIITRSHIQHEKIKAQRSERWKITEEGLEEFFHLTTEGFDTNLPDGDLQEKYDAVESRINATMSECFRKAKSKNKSELTVNYMIKYKTVTQFAKKGRAQRKVAKLYIEEIKKLNVAEVAVAEKEKVRSVLQKLTIDDKFSPNNFWELCKKSKNQEARATSIETNDGTELFGDSLITNAYREEFVHRLRKREMIPELKNYEKRTEQICQLYLQEARQNVEQQYTVEEYDAVRKNLKKKKACGRDLLPPEIYINAGSQLHTMILELFNQAKSANTTIHQWTQVLITCIYKNKGKRKQLVNHRGIFLKQILSKMFEKLNMNRIEPFVKQIDKAQAGSRSERSPADQTFLLRAAVDHSKYLKKPLYIVLYDYKQCFDSLWLADCLLSLWNLGVRSETLNNLKTLNETCNLVVKTPVGLTSEAKVSSIVQQGSVSGGVLCSASTAEVAKEDLGGGCQIGSTRITALAYVDDIASANTEVPDTYISHHNIVWFSKKKRIDLNVPKCIGLCINKKLGDILPRLKIDGEVIEWVNMAVYLGDQFNYAGNNKDLVEDRVKKGRTCIITAQSLCSEVTLGVYTIETLMLLYKSLFLQVVLYNSQAWSNLTKQDVSQLQTVQLKYLKRIFHAPPSTSNCFIFLETGKLPIKYEIHIRQLTFLYHILHLDESDPVKKVYYEQLKFEHESNWGNEVKKLRSLYDITETDPEIEEHSKDRWKRAVKKKVRSYALTLLNQELSTQKHGSRIKSYNELSPQQYLVELQPQKARKLFHVRAGILDIKTVRKYWYTDSVCRLCQQDEETIHHILNVCGSISRTSGLLHEFTDNMEEMEQIADRCIQFENKVREMENI